MTETEARSRVIAVAREWLGTPYHDVAGVKQVGVDCAHLVERVYAEAEVMEPLPIEPYAPQWFLHRDEERFVAHVLERGREIARADVKPADMALFRVGRCYAHGAIIVDWPHEIVHAVKAARRVVAGPVGDFGLEDRDVRFFTLW